MKPTLEQRALEVIDRMIMNQDPDEKDPFLGELYLIAHSCNRILSCHHVHKDWVEYMVKKERELKKISL